MLYNKIIETLGAEARFFEVSDIDQACRIELATELAQLLIFFKGAIVFIRGAKFKVDADIPVADEDRYVDLDIIYGLNRDSNNIFLKNSVYKDRIGEDFYTFGESASGDQYCIERESGKIYYWYHEAEHESEIKFLIAANLIEFITHLIADEEKPLIDKTKKIISATFDF
ncbi:SMI1/KNR4 family protein [Pseudomonas sp. ICMP 460]|uniref:SMI1/KNR4 family protein n=1 Tax=Pseudomonas sp. ICMP 460 TaxID=1718917 RepID=UPI000C0A41AB|nr:SMI1/KNR4 family protein [Pseudomonas sp. ICMP 460]PHN29613.1 hypothetical protein AO240_24625 [Pseudomonas sp. ICMP 460]